jgi:hypothetical protein
MIYIAYFWLLMQITFLCYLAIMNAIPNKDKIQWPAWLFLGPIVLVGVTADVILNIVLSIPFAELPKEWMTTKRLQRYRKNPETKRGKAACFICEKILNIFDPIRNHC